MPCYIPSLLIWNFWLVTRFHLSPWVVSAQWNFLSYSFIIICCIVHVSSYFIDLYTWPFQRYCVYLSWFNLENKITWINPKISLGTKMAHYKSHFLHTSENGFIIRPHYMDTHLSYALRSVIGQLWTSSHQLEIEVSRYTLIPLEERFCQLCHQGVESEENYICHCNVVCEIQREIPLPL